MPVGDVARAVLGGGLRMGLPVAQGRPLRWLSGRGHLELAAQGAPKPVLERLRLIYSDLGGSEELLASKAAARPHVDLLLGDHVAVEIDEFQHFTTARLRTLQHYAGAGVGFDAARYRVLCEQTRHRADAYRRAKTAPDFPFPGGRTAQRAYLDAVRDLLGPAHGWTILRIPAPDGDVALAVEELVQAADTLGVTS